MRLIDAEDLKKALKEAHINMELTFDIATFNCVMSTIDNAPTIEYPFYAEAYQTGYEEGKNKKPQGEYVDISKLRLMTVEECAGHTIDYAMGWKACVEWIKKGGAE